MQKSKFLNLLILLIVILSFFLLGCSSEESKILQALYTHLGIRSTNEMGGKFSLEILEAEIKGNNTKVHYLLKSSGKQIGGVQTATLSKQGDNWKVDSSGNFKR